MACPKNCRHIAKVVIVGGGVMGVGLAYHLAHEGLGPGWYRSLGERPN